MTFQACALRVAMMSGLLFSFSAVFAASVNVHVTDTAGNPVADAVVYAEGVSGQLMPQSLHRVEIEQKGRKFHPLVTVVQAGTDISFPNNDTVRHHVYSFSPAKPFELKLYSGKPSAPINFDKPGTVVLGCNIHDQMIAYVQVVPTPYFAKTDEQGDAVLTALVPGKYVLKTWDYQFPVGAPIPEQAVTISRDDVNATFALILKAR